MSGEEEDIPPTIVLNEPIYQGKAVKDALTTTGKLICLAPKDLESGAPGEFWLTQSEETIGRDKHCSVQVKSASLTLVHARITAYSDQWLIEVCDSRHGIWINDSAVETRSKLTSGDVVKLGRLPFRFEVINVAPTEFATVPDSPEETGEREKIRMAETLQLELSADGALVDVSSGKPVYSASAKPGTEKPAAKAEPDPLKAAKPKLAGASNLVGVAAAGAKSMGQELDSALKELQQALPQIVRMLVKEAREGNVDAACACLIFAAGEEPPRPAEQHPERKSAS